MSSTFEEHDATIPGGPVVSSDDWVVVNDYERGPEIGESAPEVPVPVPGASASEQMPLPVTITEPALARLPTQAVPRAEQNGGRRLLAEMPEAAFETLAAMLPTYGDYGGRLWSAGERVDVGGSVNWDRPGVDDLDKAFRLHDIGWAAAELASPDLAAQLRSAADLALANRVGELPSGQYNPAMLAALQTWFGRGQALGPGVAADVLSADAREVFERGGVPDEIRAAFGLAPGASVRLDGDIVDTLAVDQPTALSAVLARVLMARGMPADRARFTAKTDYYFRDAQQKPLNPLTLAENGGVYNVLRRMTGGYCTVARIAPRRATLSQDGLWEECLTNRLHTLNLPIQGWPMSEATPELRLTGGRFLTLELDGVHQRAVLTCDGRITSTTPWVPLGWNVLAAAYAYVALSDRGCGFPGFPSAVRRTVPTVVVEVCRLKFELPATAPLWPAVAVSWAHALKRWRDETDDCDGVPWCEIVPLAQYAQDGFNAWYVVDGMSIVSRKPLSVRAQRVAGCCVSLHSQGFAALEGQLTGTVNTPIGVLPIRVGVCVYEEVARVLADRAIFDISKQVLEGHIKLIVNGVYRLPGHLVMPGAHVALVPKLRGGAEPEADIPDGKMEAAPAVAGSSSARADDGFTVWTSSGMGSIDKLVNTAIEEFERLARLGAEPSREGRLTDALNASAGLSLSNRDNWIASIGLIGRQRDFIAPQQITSTIVLPRWTAWSAVANFGNTVVEVTTRLQRRTAIPARVSGYEVSWLTSPALAAAFDAAAGTTISPLSQLLRISQKSNMPGLDLVNASVLLNNLSNAPTAAQTDPALLMIKLLGYATRLYAEPTAGVFGNDALIAQQPAYFAPASGTHYPGMLPPYLGTGVVNGVFCTLTEYLTALCVKPENTSVLHNWNAAFNPSLWGSEVAVVPIGKAVRAMDGLTFSWWVLAHLGFPYINGASAVSIINAETGNNFISPTLQWTPCSIVGPTSRVLFVLADEGDTSWIPAPTVDYELPNGVSVPRGPHAASAGTAISGFFEAIIHGDAVNGWGADNTFALSRAMSYWRSSLGNPESEAAAFKAACELFWMVAPTASGVRLDGMSNVGDPRAYSMSVLANTTTVEVKREHVLINNLPGWQLHAISRPCSPLARCCSSLMGYTNIDQFPVAYHVANWSHILEVLAANGMVSRGSPCTDAVLDCGVAIERMLLMCECLGHITEGSLRAGGVGVHDAMRAQTRPTWQRSVANRVISGWLRESTKELSGLRLRATNPPEGDMDGTEAFFDNLGCDLSLTWGPSWVGTQNAELAAPPAEQDMSSWRHIAYAGTPVNKVSTGIREWGPGVYDWLRWRLYAFNRGSTATNAEFFRIGYAATSGQLIARYFDAKNWLDVLNSQRVASRMSSMINVTSVASTQIVSLPMTLLTPIEHDTLELRALVAVGGASIAALPPMGWRYVPGTQYMAAHFHFGPKLPGSRNPPVSFR
jgi:hypothetical protein